MSIGTEKLVAPSHERYCLQLNVDNYEVESYRDSYESIIVGGKVFYPWLVRVTKNNKKYSFIVPVITKSKIYKVFPFTFTFYVYDIAAMEENTKQIIARL